MLDWVKLVVMLVVQIVVICAFLFTMNSQVSANEEDLQDHEDRLRNIETAVMDLKHLADDVSEIKDVVLDYSGKRS